MFAYIIFSGVVIFTRVDILLTNMIGCLTKSKTEDWNLMFDIHVKYTMNIPIELVFETLSQHGKYGEFKAVKYAALIEQGTTELNGVGALREVHVGPLQLMERITVFERPNRLDYHIESAKPVKITHQIGSIQLTKIDENNTDVNWISQGNIHMPLLGWFIDKKFSRDGAKGFLSLLKQIERDHQAI